MARETARSTNPWATNLHVFIFGSYLNHIVDRGGRPLAHTYRNSVSLEKVRNRIQERPCPHSSLRKKEISTIQLKKRVLSLLSRNRLDS